MSERFLRKNEIAAKLNCGWKKARSILASHGVLPVDYGVGKGGGLRWLESAVDAAILAMHRAAQPPQGGVRSLPVVRRPPNPQWEAKRSAGDGIRGAQPKPPRQKAPKPFLGASSPLAEMRTSELYAYLESQNRVQ